MAIHCRTIIWQGTFFEGTCEIPEELKCHWRAKPKMSQQKENRAKYHVNFGFDSALELARSNEKAFAFNLQLAR